MDEQTKKDMLGIYFTTVDISEICVLVEEIPFNWGNSPQTVEYNHMVEQLVAEWLVDELDEDMCAFYLGAYGSLVVDTANMPVSSIMDLVKNGKEEPVELGWWGKLRSFTLFKSFLTKRSRLFRKSLK